MSERNKRLLFLILTLPGAAVPFLGFAEEVSPVEYLAHALMELCTVLGIPPTPSVDLLFCVPWTVPFVLPYCAVFAPLVMLLLDAYRLRGHAIPSAVTWIVSFYALVVGYALVADAPLGLGPMAIVAALAAYAWHREASIESVAEVGLMGTFVAALTTYVCLYGMEERFEIPEPVGLDVGAYVAVFACVVFLVRIIDTLRHPPAAQPT